MNATAMQPHAVANKLDGMNITIDFETHYSAEYTIRKLGVINYIRDPRFKIHGVGIQIDDQPAEWWTEDLANKLAAIDWSQAKLICHNMLFDGSILFEHFGIEPAAYADTAALARGLLPPKYSVSLNSVATTLGLGNKIEGTLESTKGLTDLTQKHLAQLGKYCLEDVRLTRAIFDMLYAAYNANEQNLINLTCRMACAPRLTIDVALSTQALESAIANKESAIAASHVEKSTLTSNPKFANYLSSLGLDVPTKTSLRTNKNTPALGQNDPEFIELMTAHPELSHVWEARQEAMSNIGESRAKRWIQLGTTGSKLLPFPLVYYGASTGRFSGTDSINVMNLPRGGLLRKAITAPAGFKLVVADSAQIELRVNAWFASQHETLNALRDGTDLYRAFAASFFNVYPEDVSKEMRSYAKAVILGCGYGMGHKKFIHYCASGPLGLDPIKITEENAAKTILHYRNTHNAIAGMWKKLDQVIDLMSLPTINKEFGCLQILHEELKLPNGNSMYYPELEPTEDGWIYNKSRGMRKLYGAKLCENICQALARIIVTEQMLAADQIPNVRVVGMVHDEIICLAPENKADEVLTTLLETMSTPPSWAKNLPLAAEGFVSQRYDK